MNKSQAEKKVYAFHAVFRVDVNDERPFQILTETSPFDHFFDPQSMPILFKIINRWSIQTLLLLTLFQQIIKPLLATANYMDDTDRTSHSVPHMGQYQLLSVLAARLSPLNIDHSCNLPVEICGINCTEKYTNL